MLKTNFRTRARPGLIANALSISCLTKNKRREKRHVKYMVAGLVSNSNNRYWPRGVPSSFDFMAAITLCSRNFQNVKLRPTVWKFKNDCATQI